MPILELQSVSKHFGAIHALNEVDLTLEEGEVLGLMGDNGAGKSTLVKVIAGNFPPTHGEIRIDGEAVHFHKPVEAREKGVEVVYQDLALCNNLSAAANVFLGREIKRGAGRSAGSTTRRWRGAPANCSASSSPRRRPRDLVRQMSGGQRQAVAIARTRLSQGAHGADGRADRRDLGPAGRRGSRPHPAPQGFRHGDHAHQPSHARRVRGLRSGHGDAPRPQGRRQGDQGDEPEEVTGLITGAIHAA